MNEFKQVELTVEEALKFLLGKKEYENIVCIKNLKKYFKRRFVSTSKNPKFYLCDFFDNNKNEFANIGNLPIIWTKERIYVFIQDFEYNNDYVVVKRNPKK